MQAVAAREGAGWEGLATISMPVLPRLDSWSTATAGSHRGPHAHNPFTSAEQKGPSSPQHLPRQVRGPFRDFPLSGVDRPLIVSDRNGRKVP